MYEEKFMSSWLREDKEGNRKSGKTWAKKERESEREVDKEVVKRTCVKPVSVEAFDIFSQWEMSEWDSCGVDSDCEFGNMVW